MNYLEVSCVNQPMIAWHCEVKTYLYAFYIALACGSDCNVVLIDITLRSSDLLLAIIDPTTLTCLLSSILQTLTCLPPLVFDIL